MAELLIGCGRKPWKKRLAVGGNAEWSKLTTIDMNPDHEPDIVHDISVRPLPFADDSFDEIHAYEVLEHIGQQGDWRSFFAEWSEWWRILKHDGVLIGTSPAATSPWAWGDPGHTRIISPECLTYLDQRQYTEQIGRTRMTDYRFAYQADFECVHSHYNGDEFQYAMRAVKPSRITV